MCLTMILSPTLDKQSLKIYGSNASYTARGPLDATFGYVGLNGLMGSGDSFWPVIEGVPEEWRVVLPDLPGCGESEPLPPPRKHDVDAYAKWLDQFIERAGLADKRLVLASIATAAPVSIRYSVWHKDRIAGQVMHLPFLGKPAIANKWLRPLVAYALLVPALRDLAGTLRSSDDLMHRIILHEPPQAIPMLAERDIDHKQQADLHAAGELLHALMLTDSRIELARITTPLLILASEHDFSAPVPMLEQIVAGHPERRLYVERGGAHSWTEQFLAEMNREIADFVRLLV
jgi:pimeloyl-ACP methyl ester carboxylesterase